MVQLTTPKVKVFDQVEINIAAIAEAITFNTQITACEVTMPISVSGSAIQLPIDVQGSFIMLPIDIQGQIGELNIKCGDVAGNVNICIASTQKVGVFLQPEWAAKQQTDKNLIGVGSNKGFGEAAIVQYIVAAAEGFYVCGASAQINAQSSGDYDHFVYCKLEVEDTTAGTSLGVTGGIGGAVIPFGKPMRVPAGNLVTGRCYNFSSLTCSCTVVIWGYEI